MFKAIIAAFVIIAILASRLFDDASGQLPSAIGIDRVVTSFSDPGLRENCVYVEYALTDETSARLRADGLAFLETAGKPPSENPKNPYVGWRATPVDLNTIPHAFWSGAAAGCGGDGKYDVYKSLTTQGAYFATTANDEGLIVLDPVRKIAFFLYFG